MNLIIRFAKFVGLVGVFALCTLLVFPIHSASAASSCQTAPSEANCTGKVRKPLAAMPMRITLPALRSPGQYAPWYATRQPVAPHGHAASI